MDADPSDVANKIPHGEHLTWTDVMRSKFHPVVDTDEHTGATVYPRKDFLTNAAATRAAQAAHDARMKSGS